MINMTNVELVREKSGMRQWAVTTDALDWDGNARKIGVLETIDADHTFSNGDVPAYSGRREAIEAVMVHRGELDVETANKFLAQIGYKITFNQ